MNDVKLTQGSSEWLEWRKTGIGSSDAPVIMDESPYKSIYRLWKEKTGQCSESIPDTFAMERGRRIEPRVRAMISTVQDMHFEPRTFEREWNGHKLIASLDGYNEDLNIALEIKLIGKEDFERAKCPARYYSQIQHQLLVTGAAYAIYAGYYIPCDGSSELQGLLVVDQVAVDLDWQARYALALDFFKHCVDSKTSPSDVLMINAKVDPRTFNADLFEYFTLSQEITQLEARRGRLKDALETSMNTLGVSKLECASGVVTKVTRVGSVDTAALAQAGGLDAEAYRKPATHYYKFSAPKVLGGDV